MGGMGGTAGSGGGAGGVGGAAGQGGVGGVPPAGPNSLFLIQEALQSGDIGDVDALRYEIFAVFGDERLPGEYRSDVTIEEGTRVLIEAVERFESLPPDVRDELDPFLRAPADADSWFQLRQAANRQGPSIVPKGGDPVVSFTAVPSINNRVLVQWPTASPGLQADALKVVAALDGENGVWTKLTSLMDREPVSDLGILEKYNGGDGRFDIYIIEDANVVTEDLQTAVGWTAPYSSGTTNNTRAAYLVINRDKIAAASSPFDKKIKANLAHEFMHVLALAHNVKDSWVDGYAFLLESTATWAEHYVFPDDQVETEGVQGYFNNPKINLSRVDESREYTAYVYWLFLTDQSGGQASIVSQAWKEAESKGEIEAANAATPGGFKSKFGDFAVAIWNRAPFNTKDPYNVYDKDGMANRVFVKETTAVGNPQAENEIEFDRGGIDRLSSQWMHFKTIEQDARSLLFANGYTFRLQEGLPPSLAGALGDEILYAEQMSPEDRDGRQVLALIKQNGTWSPDPFDLTNVAFAPFCQEVAGESIEELVLIFVNSEHDESEPPRAEPQGLTPRLFATNVGCGDWVGNADLRTFTVDGGDVFSSFVDMEIEASRGKLSLADIAAGKGQLPFGDVIIHSGAGFGITAPGIDYKLSDVQGTWAVDESFTRGDATCDGSGNGSFNTTNVLTSAFAVSPYLRAKASGDIPSLYRSFFITAIFAGAFEFTGQCSDGDTYTDSFIPALVGGYNNSEYGTLTVDSSGFQITENWSVGDVDFTLSLSSVP
jgi:hypothetical protein